MHQRAQVITATRGSAIPRSVEQPANQPEENDFDAVFKRNFRVSLKYTQLAKNKHRYRIIVSRKGRAQANTFLDRQTLFCESQILSRREFAMYGSTPAVNFKGTDQDGNLLFELSNPAGVAALLVEQKSINIQKVLSLK